MKKKKREGKKLGERSTTGLALNTDVDPQLKFTDLIFGFSVIDLVSTNLVFLVTGLILPHSLILIGYWKQVVWLLFKSCSQLKPLRLKVFRSGNHRQP